MKGSKLPVYGLAVVIALAIVYRIVSPPAPLLPGPIGAFPTWKSISTRGQMTAQATDQAGTMWAGAWSQKDSDTNAGQTAVHIIDLNGFAAANTDLGKDTTAQYLSWADEKTLRVLCAGPGSKLEIAYIDAQTGKKDHSVPIETSVQDVLSWPAGSDKFAAVLEDKDQNLKMAILSESGKVVGKEVSLALPKNAAIDSGAGIAADGNSFVFAISDPAAKDGKSFYLADTAAGTAKKTFDLGDMPGRIEGMWPSAAGVLMVCKVKEKLEDVIWDPASGKLAVQSGAVDLAKYPGAPKTMAFTTYDGGYEFDLASGKTATILDMSKRNSVNDKGWRDFLRDSRLYKIKSGNFITVSETGGAVDIRELKPDGTMNRALLSRM